MKNLFAVLLLILAAAIASSAQSIGNAKRTYSRTGAPGTTPCLKGPIWTDTWLNLTNGHLYYCSTGGSPGAWTDMSGGGAGGSALVSPVTIGVGQNTSATTDLLINPTTKGSGNLIDAQVNGVSKFRTDSNGAVISQGLGSFQGSMNALSYNTLTNCADSAGAAACGSSPSGAFVIDAATTSTVVSTTAVTANSQIHVQEDSSLNTRLSVTCNTQSSLVLGSPRVTARTTGTSFTVTIELGPTTNPMCLNYTIIN